MICYQSAEVLNFHRNTAVSVGKFNGLHLGHQALLSRLKEAAGLDLDTLVLRIDAENSQERRLLLTEEETRSFLTREQITYDVRLPLSGAFREMSREEFACVFIPERLRGSIVVTGSDFRFGKNAEGDAEYLKYAGKKSGYHVLLLADCYDGKDKISSTLIRNLLSEGSIERANRCLGYIYSITGTVVHGRALAGRLGFPTINIIPPEQKVLPRFGVYKTRVQLDGKAYTGLANIGVKPTVTNDAKPLLEVHLLDFSGDLYGRYTEVLFESFIRPEMHFQGIDALKRQMEKDIQCLLP